MKTLVTFLLLSIGMAYGQSNSKGPNSPVAVGVITAVSDDEKTITILQAEQYPRDLVIGEKTKVNFVGMEKKDRELVVGYGVKAKIKGSNVGFINVSKPLTEPAHLGDDRHLLSVEQILEKSDDDGNETIDYVEMSKWIYRSPKHGADHFLGADSDGDGGLDEEELEKLLTGVSWWKYSRQSAGDWFAQADANGDGALDLREFTTICSGKSHADSHFKRTDVDKNGTLDTGETATYVQKLIGGSEELE